MGYLLNTKNGRVFADGPNFAKMQGMLRITDEQAEAIMAGRISGEDVLPRYADAADDEAVRAAIEKAAGQQAGEPPAREPVVSITMSPEEEERLREGIREMEEEERAEAVERGDAAEGFSRDNVTVADVVALADDELAPFAKAVFQMSANAGAESPDDLRGRMVKVAARLEKRRAKAQEQD